jgi:cyclophilin family peptidyl-prolyl cis-trans isomerase
MRVGIQTPAATLGIRGTRFDVQVTPQGTELAVIEGEVEISGPFGTQRVGAGRTFRVTASGGDFASAPSNEMQRAVVAMFTVLGRQGDYRTQLANYPAIVSLGRPTASAPAAAPPSTIAPPAGIVAPAFIAPPAGIRPPQPQVSVAAAIQGRDRNELLFIDLPQGRVVIQLRADLAPQHVARVKALARQGFYNGLAFHNVRPGFTAETGDPTGTGRGGTGQPLAPEISGEPFRAGSVGMVTQPNRPFTADSQFFITLSDQLHLNGRYTIWGQVVHGLELLESLPPGSPPRDPTRIVQALIATDDR